jgi:hypothetical protein
MDVMLFLIFIIVLVPHFFVTKKINGKFKQIDCSPTPVHVCTESMIKHSEKTDIAIHLPVWGGMAKPIQKWVTSYLNIQEKFLELEIEATRNVHIWCIVTLPMYMGNNNSYFNK